MTFYQHKNGGVYRVLTRRFAYAELHEHESVLVDLGEEDAVALVTDDIAMGEEFVTYQRLSDDACFARPARLFDDPTRFKELSRE